MTFQGWWGYLLDIHACKQNAYMIFIQLKRSQNTEYRIDFLNKFDKSKKCATFCAHKYTDLDDVVAPRTAFSVELRFCS